MLDLIAEYNNLVKAFQVYTCDQEGLLFRFKAKLSLVAGVDYDSL
jgi:hypothetical protein